jgi:hypothetical protein
MDLPLVTCQINETDHLGTLGTYLIPRHLFPLCRGEVLQVDACSVSGWDYRFTSGREPENLRKVEVRNIDTGAVRMGLTSIPTLDVRPVSTSCLCLNKATRA